MKELIVPERFDGKKLSRFLVHSIETLDIHTVYKLLRKKDIKLNGKRIHENVILKRNDIVIIYLKDEDSGIKKIDFEIIYEDENILAVNKPRALEVVGDHSLTSLLRAKFNTLENNFPAPCHRLDRNTTGLILYAKNEESLHILLEKFKDHEIEKKYRAVVYGIPKKKEETVESFLFKDRKKSLVYISDVFKNGYQKIKTSYTVLEKDLKNNISILEVILHTGKTHQIRAHLAHLGLPIIGDGKYGNNQINKAFGKTSQMLISYSIQFNFETDAGLLHYLNGKEIVYSNNFSNSLPDITSFSNNNPANS